MCVCKLHCSIYDKKKNIFELICAKETIFNLVCLNGSLESCEILHAAGEPSYHLGCSCNLFIMVKFEYKHIIAVRLLCTLSWSHKELYSVKLIDTTGIHLQQSFSLYFNMSL